jgi:hypothetical protein
VPNLRGFITTCILATATGAITPALARAQDVSKPDCPPPVLLNILSGAPNLSVINAILAMPVNHTGHVLSPVYVPTPDLGYFDQAFQFQIYRPKKSVDLGFLGNQYIDASVVKEKDLDQVFKQLADDQEIPFNYPKDGCYARAEEMTRLLEKDGITAVKVFVEGRLEVQTPHAAGGKVDWWYHVAPVVLVENSSHQYVPMVIDPSIFDHPVTTDEWVAIQTQATPDQTPKVYYRDRYTYLPQSDPQDQSPQFLDSDLANSAWIMKKFKKLESP